MCVSVSVSVYVCVKLKNNLLDIVKTLKRSYLSQTLISSQIFLKTALWYQVTPISVSIFTNVN